MNRRLVTCLVLLQAWPVTPAGAQDRVESPALRALAEAAARDPSAVPGFWSRMAATGTPIVERVDGEPDQQLVTFVWRDSGHTDGVAVITPMSLIDIELGRMRLLPATDVWYRSFRMPHDAVMMYRFGPDDSMVPFARERNFARRMAGWKLDPLNPLTFGYGDGTSGSVLRLSRPEGAAGVAASPHGRLQIDSVPVAEGRPAQPVTVYVPPRYDASTRHPVVLFMDGDLYLGLIHIDSVLDRLSAEQPDRAPIAVMIPADAATRSRQYDCNEEWTGFLAARLVPWIEQRYAVSRDPRDRIVAGYSLGGLAAACAAVARPDVLGNVLAQSASFYRPLGTGEPEALARRLADTTMLPIRWNLSIGRLETSAIPSADPSMLTASRHMRDVLAARGYSFDYHEFYGGHEHVAWATLLPAALARLLQPR